MRSAPCVLSPPSVQNADTGVSKYKVVSVYHVNGRIPYATVGFAAMIGAITGMSAAGITVHGESPCGGWRRAFFHSWLLLSSS